MNYWIIKSDPESYCWTDMKRDGETFWDGVRNYQARNNLKLMEVGDIALFYHSNTDKSIMGEVSLLSMAYQDPTTDDERWVAVDVKFKTEYAKPITLKEMKEHEFLREVSLVKQSRLSVMPINEDEYKEIYKLSNP